MKAEVRRIDQDPRKGDDIGVFIGETLLRTFNSLSDDYAYVNAGDYAKQVNEGKA